jgi:hypothetical protein
VTSELNIALDRLRRDTIVSALVIEPDGDRIELRHTGDTWTVSGFPADSIAVDRMHRAIPEARLGDLVARSPGNHTRLGVSNDSAWTVELHGMRDTVRLLLGKVGPTYPSAYVRMPGQDAVYELLGDFRNALAISLNDWRDKIIFRADTAAVRTILIERDTGRIALQRDSLTWRATATTGRRRQEIAGSPDTTRLADLLAELARFDATGFPADTTSFDGKESRRVFAIGASGDTLVAIEFAGQEYTWLARLRGNPQLFQVASYRVDRIAPKPEEILRQPGS